MFHFQVLDTILEYRCKAPVICRRHIADIAVHEQGSRLGPGDMPGLDARIRTPDPENGGTLSFYEFLIVINVLSEYRFLEFFVSFE